VNKSGVRADAENYPQIILRAPQDLPLTESGARRASARAYELIPAIRALY
jgi:hypothetical protein